MSDLDGLLARVQADEPGAHRELMSGLYAALRRHLRGRGSRAPSDLDDLVQATLLVLVRRLGSRFDSFEPAHPRAFTVFVLKVADFVQQSHRTTFARAAERRSPSARASEQLDRGRSVSKWVADREVLAMLDTWIAELGSGEQRSLWAKLDDESWRVQVEREGVERVTVRARLTRVRAKMRTRARDAGLID
jgi:DNA-directed RNA polymerase specialized sigma24 family protein